MTEAAEAAAPPGARLRRAAPLALVLVLAALLRALGLGWGLPNEDHLATYRADEWRAVVMGMDLDLVHGELTPRHEGAPYFNWGTLHLYGVSLACAAADALGWLETEGDVYTWDVATFRRGTLLARWVSVAAGLAAVALLYALAARWYGRSAGLVAALLLALGPLDAIEAHFAAVNVTAACAVLLALGGVVRAAERGDARAYLVAGLAIGLALSAKLSALPLVPLVAGAALWSALRGPTTRGALRRLLPRVGAAWGGALVGFALAGPAALAHPLEFARQAWEQLWVVPSRGSALAFADTGNGFRFLLLVNLPLVLGPVAWAAALAAVSWTAARSVRALARGGWRAPEPELVRDVVCLACLALYAAPLGLSQTRFTRYLLPLTPLLYALTARAWMVLARRVARLERARLAARSAFAALSLVGLAWTAAYVVAHVEALRRPDPRDEAVAWLREHVPGGSRVALITFPTHLVPPAHPFSRPIGTRLRTRAAQRRGDEYGHRWLILRRDPEELAALLPEYVLFNEKELASYLRVGDADVTRFFEALARDYVDVGGPWRNDVALCGHDFGAGPDEVRGWAPASVEVRLVQRRDLAAAAPTPAR